MVCSLLMSLFPVSVFAYHSLHHLFDRYLSFMQILKLKFCQCAQVAVDGIWKVCPESGGPIQFPGFNGTQYLFLNVQVLEF